MSSEGLRTGVIVGEAGCARIRSGLGHGPHADGRSRGPAFGITPPGWLRAIQWPSFPGRNRLDRSFHKEGRLIRVAASASAYGNPAAAGLAASAAQQERPGPPFHHPGTPRLLWLIGGRERTIPPTGSPSSNAALDAIKQRHGIARFGVSSQRAVGRRWPASCRCEATSIAPPSVRRSPPLTSASRH